VKVQIEQQDSNEAQDIMGQELSTTRPKASMHTGRPPVARIKHRKDNNFHQKDFEK